MSEEEEEKPKKRGRKRKKREEEENDSADSSQSRIPSKREKIAFELEKDILHHINTDECNSKTWEECKSLLSDGKSAFLSAVEERFLCICCQLLVNEPVTTPCKHNVCSSCLQRSFKAEVFTCPACRFDLGKKFNTKPNIHLKNALKSLFPGYDAGR
ncbi:E3 ubiquitin-protein ligase UHRF1 [Armadillidium nasatum]|uniref:E3 ubiquitin-protein ligase UHRF1 n=1 Tax=Armadillidium nasatum TaxID=96803 RepID=A0A5N5T743_9CRUS|nr:E3 ubiquitin-protein ligase UHRF1 [Armadillidium nasatum]